MADYEKQVGCGILSIFAVIGLLIFVAMQYEPEMCRRRWADHETRYTDHVSGCQVKVNGKWWPEDRVRATED